MIDLYASSEHYVDHLWPIWIELQKRGVAEGAYSARGGVWWREAVGPRPIAHRGTQPVLVGSYVDYQHTHPAPVVYVEHGAGQTYDGDERSAGHASYSGAGGFDRVVLFVCPSERVAERWRERYPMTRTVVVGCPKLDRWQKARGIPGGRGLQQEAIVAVTFHWDCPLVPETLSAWRHYDRSLPQLVEWASEHDVELLGHAHPRIARPLGERWRRVGVEFVPRFDDVIARAGCLVGDNTSALFEFASLDRPVVVLNAPWYRRDVDHGGRFWSWADVGVQVDEAHELIDGLVDGLADRREVRANRERIVAEVYAHRDGQAAARAADAIVEALDGYTVHRGRDTTIPRGF